MIKKVKTATFFPNTIAKYLKMCDNIIYIYKGALKKFDSLKRKDQDYNYEQYRLYRPRRRGREKNEIQ